VVCGSTGETPLLSVAERLELMEWVRSAAAEGKILIAGVGAESVQETVQIANRAAELGFHAALALTPFYYRSQMHRPDTQALFFRAVADRSRLPILLYNIPQVTSYDLPVETIADLSHHPNIIGMKDSSGNVQKLAETVRAVKPGFQVLSGSGVSFCEALASGASGAILAIANPVPYACVTVWEAFRTREHEAARDWQSRITPACRVVAAKYGIPGLKYAMDLNGYYGGPPRLPLLPPSSEAKAEIEEAFHGLCS
jgi:4-hydroxy-2-oxoglutarate aldolase